MTSGMPAPSDTAHANELMRSTNALLARVIVELRTQRAQIGSLTQKNQTLLATVNEQYHTIKALEKKIEDKKRRIKVEDVLTSHAASASAFGHAGVASLGGHHARALPVASATTAHDHSHAKDTSTASRPWKT